MTARNFFIVLVFNTNNCLPIFFFEFCLQVLRYFANIAYSVAGMKIRCRGWDVEF